MNVITQFFLCVFLTSHPNRTLHIVSFLPFSPWERAPSRALHPGLCAKCYLAVEHYLEFTRISRGRRGGNFSAVGGCSRCLGRGWEGGGLAWLLVALRGSAWQIIDLSGRKLQHRHICECSDCY